ncbi:MAG: glycosyltransferase [Fervidobacterium sp.]|uniref:glycosyltransferase n=1 Tax=Fervidobacterium sp. TaxID=1871331 RepID=UPI0025B950AF|nr:glycosyltransferase [Fervidobacterium sp.]NPU89985.1 glycosyltransferase [Fervidobacterium sp.]
MKVFMLPTYDMATNMPEGGIKQVLLAWYLRANDYDINFSDNDSDCDLVATHAGFSRRVTDVAHLHGLYWTGDKKLGSAEYHLNQLIIDAIRSALLITVPSKWISKTFERDMHISPYLLPHGIDLDEWGDVEDSDNYVLWNKNRTGVDVCDVNTVTALANMARDVQFVCTFEPKNLLYGNVKVCGVVPHNEMKKIVKRAGVYLSTTKESFGIGILEALASGVPVIGWDIGGNSTLIENGVNGILVPENDYNLLFMALQEVTKNRKKYSVAAREIAKRFTWDIVMQKLYSIYSTALNIKQQPPVVSVVIPVYNYAKYVGRAIDSVLAQSYPKNLLNIIVVDDGSTDNIQDAIAPYIDKITYIRKANSGVADTRNVGAKVAIEEKHSKYLCFLDADDTIEHLFVQTCVSALEADRRCYIAYTRFSLVYPNGDKVLAEWPQNDFSMEEQMRGHNQIPTCCMMRKDVIIRTGGYDSAFCPSGAGTEDANLWLRAAALGMTPKKVSDAPLFNYYLGGNTSKKDNVFVNWYSIYPWVKDSIHPFASVAKPVKHSHPVFQYDDPVVSVIIPVGKGHSNTVLDAIESVENQTFRNWEIIVVWDSDEEIPDKLYSKYPFVEIIKTEGFTGAGHARNLGVKNAKGVWLFFLDADDMLYPSCLSEMLAVANDKDLINNKEYIIVYSDYDGKSIVTKEYANTVSSENRLIKYDDKTGVAIIRCRSLDYDCERAQRQPDVNAKDLYHWCLVSCLIPRGLHDIIGGFDESMSTWEDIDYHWRIAKHGICYIRIPRALMLYRFYTGFRRNIANPTIGDDNLNKAKSVIEYLVNKYKEIKMTPCQSCHGSRVHPSYDKQNYISNNESARATSNSDDNYVLCLYNSINKGIHPVVGGGTGTRYGYRAGGDKFLVHKSDISARPDLFIPIEVTSQKKSVGSDSNIIANKGNNIVTGNATGDSVISVSDDFRSILLHLPFITKRNIDYVIAAGVRSLEDAKQMSVDDWAKINGIGQKKARVIYDLFHNNNK